MPTEAHPPAAAWETRCGAAGCPRQVAAGRLLYCDPCLGSPGVICDHPIQDPQETDRVWRYVCVDCGADCGPVDQEGC